MPLYPRSDSCLTCVCSKLKLFAHLPDIDRFEKTWNSFATDAEGTRFALEQIELVKQRTAVRHVWTAYGDSRVGSHLPSSHLI